LLVGELGVFEAAPLGVVFMLLSALSWGAGTVVQKHVDWKLPPLPLVGWQLLIGGLPITIVALIVDGPHLEPVSAAAIWSSLYILVFPIILAWVAWFKVISMVSITVISVATLFVPVLGVISGNVVLSEPIGWREVISLILVCASLTLVMKKGDTS